MKTFLTLMYFALVALAAAKPNGSGYTYQQQVKTVVQTQPQQTFVASAPAPVAQFVQQQPQFAAPAQTFVAATQFVAPAPQYVAPVQQQVVFSHSAPVQQPTIVSKEIFIHAAPEETEEISANQGPAELIPIRKNYRVVFIKAPTQNLKLNLDAIKRSQAANEEKTIIYVLSKKPDIANIQNQLSAVHTEQKGQKPEVYFIKYKTQEEAQRAQQEIQAQYDALGGPTRVSDEGFAPVASVIGGGSVNIGPIGSGNFGGVSVGAPTFASNAGSNFAQTSAIGQQQFGSAAANGFTGDATSVKYLPPGSKK